MVLQPWDSLHSALREKHSFRIPEMFYVRVGQAHRRNFIELVFCKLKQMKNVHGRVGGILCRWFCWLI